jgi:predicted ATPase/class 3 adenylate cyclase
MESTPAGERDRWRADLVHALAAIAGTLGTLVPELNPILGPAPEAVDLTVLDLTAADSRRRLQRAAIRLIAVTAAYRPVVLAVDDLQWADRDSVLLLSEVLAASIRNVVLVAAHRADEVDPDVLDPGSTSVQTVALHPLSTADLEALLAQVCGRTADLGDVATEFHHRTGGNPLQVRQLLRRAQRERALTASGTGGHPSWDLRALTAIEITTDVAEFLGRAVDQLRPADAEVLGALACLGHEFDLADAVVAAAQPAEQVATALWAALDLRLVEAVDTGGRRIAQVIDRTVRYRFSHDRVADAARARVTDGARRAVHLRFGRWLAGRGDARLFEAARHLGVTGVEPRDEAERLRFVGVQRHAAERARRQASFPVALGCYRAALALLGEQRWVAYPHATRELQLGAAEAAYLVADAAVLASLLDEAGRMLHDPADRVRLAFLRLKQEVAENRLADAVHTGLRALDAIGEGLPHHPGKPHAVTALAWLKVRTLRWSDERLLALPRCADPRTVEVQRILGELRNVSFMVRPELFPVIVRKELELILAQGLVPSSPAALASYGVLLVLTGDLVGAQRFGEVGLLLADRAEFRDARPQTRFLHLHFIRPWQRPIAEAVPQLRDAVRDALDRGDLEYAGFLAAILLYQSLWAGHPYSEVDALARSVIPEIRSQRVPGSMCRSVQQLCLNLMGRADDLFLLAGESGYDERRVLPVARREHDVVAQAGASVIKLGLHFWSGDDAGAIPHAQETARYLDALAGTPNRQLFHLVDALARIRAAPTARATAEAARRSIRLHRGWAAVAPENYAAQCALVDGAWARARGHLRRAERLLDRAIALAEEHRLPQISALAHEEAAALYSATGRAPVSRLMLRAAYERWLGLGLTVRTERLERTHPWLTGRDLVAPHAATVDPVGMHRLGQALATATTRHDVAEILLGAAADTTGADRVLLLTGDDGHVDVRAVRRAGVTALVAGTSDAEPHDRSIVDEAMRGGRPAGGSTTLVVPVRLRGRSIGALYVDRDRPAHDLRPVHEEALVALCAQAAAPLWNFELEDRLHEADEQRQSLVEAQSRFIPAELLRILDVDDIRRVRGGHRVEREMTVLISDIRGYTALLEDISPSEAGELAMGFLRAVELPIITSNGLLQDVRGDEVLAIFESGPDDAVAAGLAMLRSLRQHNDERVARGSAELAVGIGINTGVVGLGLVGGVNRMALTVIGDAVNLASRVESTTKRYGSPLLISGETHVRLAHPDRFHLRRMERVRVVNRTQPVTIYEVYDGDPEPLRAAKRAAQPAFDAAFAWFDGGDVDRARAAFERCRALLPDDPVAPLHLAHCDAPAARNGVPGEAAALSEK